MDFFEDLSLAPIGKVLSVGVTAIGIILLCNVEKTTYFVGAGILFLVGVISLILLIRKDLKE